MRWSPICPVSRATVITGTAAWAIGSGFAANAFPRGVFGAGPNVVGWVTCASNRIAWRSAICAWDRVSYWPASSRSAPASFGFSFR